MLHCINTQQNPRYPFVYSISKLDRLLPHNDVAGLFFALFQQLQPPFSIWPTPGFKKVSHPLSLRRHSADIADLLAN